MSNEPNEILNPMKTLFHGGKPIAVYTGRASILEKLIETLRR
jgi:hypothetical protein